MNEDMVIKIFDKMNLMAIDVATIKTNLEAVDKLDHEKRLRELEGRVDQFLGSKMLLLYLITTGIAVFAAIKH